MNLETILANWRSSAPYLQSILRMIAAIMFIMTGTMKLFAYPMGMPPDNSTAVYFTQVWFGGMLETFGGFLILIGLFTRPIAFILAGEMAVAYWQFHAPMSPWPIMNNGVGAVLYCFLFLWFSAAGAGPWSVDATLRKKR
jgi:putative oxidoreductase